jgi:hypothetical protein
MLSVCSASVLDVEATAVSQQKTGKVSLCLLAGEARAALNLDRNVRKARQVSERRFLYELEVSG